MRDCGVHQLSNCGCSISSQLPVLVLKITFVRDCESIGTRISIGCALLLPDIWMSTRTASGKFVFTAVGLVVSQVSCHCDPSKQENLMLATPLNMSWSSTSGVVKASRFRTTLRTKSFP